MGTALLAPESVRTLRAYFFSALAFLLALLFRDVLTPILGLSLPHATFMVATAFSAWFLGLGPGLLTMILGLPAADYFFTPPVHTWSAFTPSELPSTFTYLVASCALVAMGVVNRRRTVELKEKNLQIGRQAAAVELTNQRLRELSASLLHSQDEERRRIARELHDSVGQYLTALGMIIGGLRGNAKDLPQNALQQLDQASQAIHSCTAEVRTISHLLHPPLLEELGLASAARWYVQGFAERSGIQVELEIPEDMDRVGEDVELVLFRVLQESLTNVHRHSGSKVALVRIGLHSQQVWLEVRDQGKGIPQGNRNALRPGVGISGMQERVRELAGVLEFVSDGAGTSVKAVIPLGPGPRKAHVDASREARQRAG
ncbi:MAG TPA: histidine kinase [Terracidiphilus sp.]|nr:histidine kinase [Terracidiphilus sp.]